ncbi:3-hydroxyacyl-ACP dehydratase FabZ [Sphaerotilus sulfidivorans]|nr:MULTISPECIES: 3-hydroxyacyl-ACP dehydratase FabZ [Sphaerotilus]MCK6400819.1 3-hydroxyacyl-ACP dehydratase FabZ [Sphaerotilus sulfidivorans]NZD45728.1 3-hydroxyacyl-ACP dehydratase FabZ [Sphaerotilus sulfidivorans]QEN02571.1 3-hydroxyacyl-ACP dehydratase FabZ [Sphaerotilus sulfidivorans]
MDIHQIMKKLPHRYPILLVDRVLDIELHKSIRAVKNITFNEPIFTGHFPRRPVFPGVLILEALAQTSALLSFTSMGEQLTDDMVVYFAGIDGARFKRPVEPGDQLILESTVDRVRAGIYKYSARATVDGMLAAEAELMCTMRRVG